MKAGDEPRADELLAEARAKAVGEMLVTYTLLVEAIRLKLPHSMKTRFTTEFNSAVADEPTPAIAGGLLVYLAELDKTGVTYHGQKTHTKKIMDFVGRLNLQACPEEDFIAILGNLVHLDGPVRMTTRFLEEAEKRFPANPFVYYYHAVHLMGDDPEAGAPMRVLWLLKEAERLGQPRNSEPAVKTMLDDVSGRLKLLMSFRGLLGSLLGGLGGFPGMAGFPGMGGFPDMGGFPFPGMFGDDDDEDDDDYY